MSRPTFSAILFAAVVLAQIEPVQQMQQHPTEKQVTVYPFAGPATATRTTGTQRRRQRRDEKREAANTATHKSVDKAMTQGQLVCDTSVGVGGAVETVTTRDDDVDGHLLTDIAACEQLHTTPTEDAGEADMTMGPVPDKTTQSSALKHEQNGLSDATNESEQEPKERVPPQLPGDDRQELGQTQGDYNEAHTQGDGNHHQTVARSNPDHNHHAVVGTCHALAEQHSIEIQVMIASDGESGEEDRIRSRGRSGQTTWFGRIRACVAKVAHHVLLAWGSRDDGEAATPNSTSIREEPKAGARTTCSSTGSAAVLDATTERLIIEPVDKDTSSMTEQLAALTQVEGTGIESSSSSNTAPCGHETHKKHQLTIEAPNTTIESEENAKQEYTRHDSGHGSSIGVQPEVTGRPECEPLPETKETLQEEDGNILTQKARGVLGLTLGKTGKRLLFGRQTSRGAVTTKEAANEAVQQERENNTTTGHNNKSESVAPIENEQVKYESKQHTIESPPQHEQYNRHDSGHGSTSGVHVTEASSLPGTEEGAQEASTSADTHTPKARGVLGHMFGKTGAKFGRKTSRVTATALVTTTTKDTTVDAGQQDCSNNNNNNLKAMTPPARAIDILEYTFKAVRKAGGVRSVSGVLAHGPNAQQWACLFDPATGAQIHKDPIKAMVRIAEAPLEPGHLLGGLVLWLVKKYGRTPLVEPPQVAALGWHILAARQAGRAFDPEDMLTALEHQVKSAVRRRDRGDANVAVERWEMVRAILVQLRRLYMPHAGVDAELAQVANALLCQVYPGCIDRTMSYDDLTERDVAVYAGVTKQGRRVFQDILTAYDMPMLEATRKKNKLAMRWNARAMPLAN